MYMEENKKPVIALTNKERFPLLNDLSLLNNLIQDTHAPKYNFKSGDRLEQHHLKEVLAYKAHTQKREHITTQPPLWLKSFINDCIKNVPFYRQRSADFLSHPSISKQEIREQPWNFVHDNATLNDLLVYQTSGTTGPAMDVNFSPSSQAAWIPQLEVILERHNIQLSYDANSTAIALICDQETTLTYASLSTYLKGSGVIKINLNPADWKKPGDQVAYLEKYNPEILTGDPIAFLSLKALNPKIQPKALISSAMKLHQPIAKELSEYFDCPVIDVYSMTECRMLAFKEGGAYRTIRPDLYFEVLASDKDEVLPIGERGELAITGGNNPYLPLIRYRTGDFCKIKIIDGIQYFEELEAREPVIFYDLSNKRINNIDISRALLKFPLAGFHLHQNKDYSLQFTGWSIFNVQDDIIHALQTIFNHTLKPEVQIKNTNQIKSNQKQTHYSSDI